MRKLSANLILPVSSPPLKNGIITLDERGRITDLTDTGGRLREERALEYYNGVIVPGFVLPWFPANYSALKNGTIASLEKLNLELPRYGIKGIGLVLSVENSSDAGFKIMASSDTIYHPVIELCPGPDEDHFKLLNRGIDLVSHAFNEFNLSCSLTACSEAMKGDLGKYLREYSVLHENVIPPSAAGSPSAVSQHSQAEPSSAVSPPSAAGSSAVSESSPENPLDILSRLLHPRKGIEEVISVFTLDAAAAIFEHDELGSIEPGKRPGLNLIEGKNTLKVLV
ncbi:MAG TPA: hypothetical protein ENI20_07875 [Bacteroides sp.]|nr:hypothetical protein [Bacteroides sp.]